MANLLFLTLYFLLKCAYFFVKVLFDNLENKLANYDTFETQGTYLLCLRCPSQK